MLFYFSYISGVTILGTPAEIYNYGTQYWLIIVPILLMGITVSTVYLPVFSLLKVGSSYEVIFSSCMVKIKLLNFFFLFFSI